MPLELVRSEAIVRVHARPHPGAETVFAEFRHGLSIREIIGPRGNLCRVDIGGFTVPEECWHLVRPRPGVAVVITRMPQGGSVKNIFRLVAFAALAVGVIAITGGAAAFAAPGLVGLTGSIGGTSLFAAGSLSAGLLAAGVGLVGSLLINALIPPQSPTSPTAASTDTLRSITGTGNKLDPYGAVPLALGQVLVYPKLAAKPFSELNGDDQYLRMLFDLGEGNPDPSEFKIGDSDLATYTDVETEIGPSPGLFPQGVDEVSVTAEMDTDGDTETRTSAIDADELSIDWGNASGLFGVDGDGNVVSVTQRVTVEYSPQGAGTWVAVDATTSGLTISTSAATPGGDGTIHVTNAARKAVRVGMRWKVTNGQYDVRFTRVDTNYGSASDDGKVGDLTWSVLRTIRYGAVSTTGTTKLALRVKATDQLNGAISQFNCIISQPIPAWHADTGTWVTEVTRNPANIFRWLMTDCPSNPRRVPLSRLDDTEIKAWAVECAAKDFVYSTCVDQTTTLFPLLQDICAAGRASFNVRDGLYSVVRDLPQSAPVQVFTPRNSSGFSGTRAFADAVHALRVQFTNPQAGWQQDERVVYDDGYGDEAMIAANPALSPATNFEVLTLLAVPDADAAWRLGRYHLAVSRLRPSTYTWNTDVEHLVCTRGDLVLFASDVISTGLAWGRISDLTQDDEGNVTSITLDEQMEPVTGTAYSMRVRRQDGTVAISSVTFATYGERTRTAMLTTPLSGVNYDDLVTFGVTGNDVLPLIITAITPGADFAAQITATDAASAVLEADSGTPPAWTSSITGQSQIEAPDPPSTVDISSSQLLSPSDDGGITQPVMIVSVTGPWSGFSRSGGAILDHIEVRYRTSDPVGQWTVLALPRGELSVSINNITRNLVYQVEARAVGITSAASNWTAQPHTTAGATLGPDEVPVLSIVSDGTSGAADRIQITWTPVPQADVYYELQRSSDDGVTFTTVFSGAGTTANSSVATGVTATFRVRAITYAGVAGPAPGVMRRSGQRNCRVSFRKRQLCAAALIRSFESCCRVSSPMSESEMTAMAALRRDFDTFRQEMGKMHADNRVDREKDRGEFKALIDQARDQFQVSVNQTFAQFQAVQQSAIRNQTLLEFAIGDGSQGSGRIGVLEKSIEQLKQFRWQALAVAAVGLWLLDKLVGHK